MKYKITIGRPTFPYASSVKFFSNANDLKNFITNTNPYMWYVVTIAKTGQEILSHNYTWKGTQYNELVKCPKALQNL